MILSIRLAEKLHCLQLMLFTGSLLLLKGIDLDPAIATDGWGNREYNTQTFDGTIVGEGAASGWWLGGKDYSDFDKVYVELSAINIPQHEVEGEMQPGFAQLFVQCAAGGDDTSDLTCGFGTHLYAVVDLDEYKNKTNQIVIQGSAGVTFTIVKACVCTNEYYEENILPNLPADPLPLWQQPSRPSAASRPTVLGTRCRVCA